jgi:hypothetical protein
MSSLHSLSFAATIIFVAAFAVSANAAENPSKESAAPQTVAGKLVPITKKDAAWAAEQRAKYPSDVCIVSEDKLGGDMGKPVDYIYRAEGKPDRLVTFCCKDCTKDFNKDPQKYLAILDRAAAKKSSGQQQPGAPGEHKH